MLEATVIGVSCVFQLAAAAAAVRMVPITGYGYAWPLIASAFGLMGLRRGLALYGIVALGASPGALAQELVALAISVLCLAGVVGMPRLFQNLDHSLHDLKIARRRLEGVLETSPVGILVSDLEGRIVMLNSMSRRMFSIPDDFDPATSRLQHSNLIHVDDRDRFEDSGRRAVESGGIARNEYQCHRGNGTTFPAEVSRATLHPEDGPGDYVVTAVKDNSDIRLTMQHLEEERRRADHYLDLVSDLVVGLDVGGRVILVNPAGLELLGKTAEDLFWKDWFEYLGSGEACCLRKAFDQIALGACNEVIRCRSQITDGEGRVREMQWRLNGLTNTRGDVTGVLISGEDITAQLATESALLEQRRVMETLLGNLPGMAYRCLNDADWTMKFVSEGALEMTGYLPSELVDNRVKSYADLVDAEFAGPLWEEVQKAVAAHTRFEITYPIVAKDGTRKWVWERGRGVYNEADELLHLEGFMTDVTRQKLAEQSLQRELDFEASLIETSPVFYCALDPDGRIIMINRAMLRSTGYTKEELIGQHFLDVFVSSQERPVLIEIFESLLVESSASWKVERLRTRDQRELVVEWHGRTVYTPDGSVDFAFGLGIDITERTRMEQQREEYQQELEALNASLQERNKELDDFTFVASHDLQEPVRKQLMFAGILRDNLSEGLNEDGRFALSAIESSAARMQRLVQDLLSLSRSRRQALNPVMCNMNECVDVALDTLSQRIEEKGNVRIEREPLPRVFADPAFMTQVFQNLIGNAIKFSDKDETVVRVHYRRDEHAQRIGIADNGIGIGGEHVGQIFEPFKRLRTREKHDGSGIGLSICRKIMERHEGAIEVDSHPGEGTTFWLVFPHEHHPVAVAEHPADFDI